MRLATLKTFGRRKSCLSGNTNTYSQQEKNVTRSILSLWSSVTLKSRNTLSSASDQSGRLMGIPSRLWVEWGREVFFGFRGGDFKSFTSNHVTHKVNESHKCIYYKTEDRLCTIICVYVDDILIFGPNLHVINDVKSMLSANFDMKELGETDVILGIKITRVENETSLDQSHYIKNILKMYNYFESKPTCIHLMTLVLNCSKTLVTVLTNPCVPVS